MDRAEQLLEDILDRIEGLERRTFEILHYINGECVKKREIRYIFIILHIIVGLLIYLVFKGTP